MISYYEVSDNFLLGVFVSKDPCLTSLFGNKPAVSYYQNLGQTSNGRTQGLAKNTEIHTKTPRKIFFLGDSKPKFILKESPSFLFPSKPPSPSAPDPRRAWLPRPTSTMLSDRVPRMLEPSLASTCPGSGSLRVQQQGGDRLFLHFLSFFFFK